ncbi:MAG TPA: cytochrome b/b6 domain-containing protein [Bryobacteraceae bacterium]|nr:cytochrome b/b6 domain-containing protein [Bryobacteraceae bacterium]
MNCFRVAVAWALWCAVIFAQAPDNSVCAACHADQVEKLGASAHSGVACASCHAKHEDYPHPEGVAKPKCEQCHASEVRRWSASKHADARAHGKNAPDCAVCHGSPHELRLTGTVAFRTAIPKLCGSCHGTQAAQYSESVHGQALAKGIVAAPVCSSCHPAHDVLPPAAAASSVNPVHVPETCGRCHGDVRLAQQFNMPRDAVVSFDASFHGLALKAGRQSVANCASCHGFHDILPSSDPRSSINAKNVRNTCGKCHTGAGARFAIGRVHWSAGRREPGAVRWIRVAYAVLIPAVIGFMFVNVAGDWMRKVLPRFFRRKRVAAIVPYTPRPRMRMPLPERVQHWLLMGSFTVLAWSGFALVYPDYWWARPISYWETTWPLRGIVHRIAATVFVILCSAHIIGIVTDAKVRRRWKTVIPRHRDIPEAVGTFAYNVGLRKTPPMVWPHAWIAKAEYWALVWGALLMSLTGAMLWANTFFLRWAPRTWLDVATAIHFYEAVLATLAILVWHMYYVMFDPDVYPMEPSWLTGYSVRRHAAENGSGASHSTGPAGEYSPRPK